MKFKQEQEDIRNLGVSFDQILPVLNDIDKRNFVIYVHSVNSMHVVQSNLLERPPLLIPPVLHYSFNDPPFKDYLS